MFTNVMEEVPDESVSACCSIEGITMVGSGRVVNVSWMLLYGRQPIPPLSLSSLTI